MGTNWRSKAFLDTFYKNLEDGGFPDRIRWIRAAAAAAAVLHHGDFYRAACAKVGTRALIQADRDFDLVVLPDAGHDCAGGWLERKKKRFFKRHLGECE